MVNAQDAEDRMAADASRVGRVSRKVVFEWGKLGGRSVHLARPEARCGTCLQIGYSLQIILVVE